MDYDAEPGTADLKPMKVGYVDRVSMVNKTASLLVVPLGTAASGIFPSRGRQMASKCATTYKYINQAYELFLYVAV